jgi:RimJ/RimL family protein N-acetyltransferase
MRNIATEAALKLLYADELRYQYIIWRIECAVPWEVLVDDPRAPAAAMIVRESSSGTEAVIMAERTSRLGALLERLPRGEITVEADRPWIAHQIGLLGPVETLVPYVRMSVSREAFRPRADERVRRFDASMVAAFKGSRIWSDPGQLDQALQRALTAQSEWVALSEGRVVSKCDVLRRTQRCSEINEVVTEASFRGHGLATAVVAAATESILSMDRVPIYTTTAGNLPSLRLAQSLGYRPVTDSVRLRAFVR